MSTIAGQPTAIRGFSMRLVAITALVAASLLSVGVSPAHAAACQANEQHTFAGYAQSAPQLVEGAYALITSRDPGALCTGQASSTSNMWAMFSGTSNASGNLGWVQSGWSKNSVGQGCYFGQYNS